MHVALNCWFCHCYNTRILNTKLSLYYFTYLLFNLRFYKRTVTRFIADDTVVYHAVRRATRLASDNDNSWARRHLKHLNWRSRWIMILCTLERGMPVSRKISQADRCVLACLPDWALMISSLRAERGLFVAWFPGNCTRLAQSSAD